MIYCVEWVVNGRCEDIYKTDSLNNAQARYDSWKADSDGVKGIEVKMYVYDDLLDNYAEIDYDGNYL